MFATKPSAIKYQFITSNSNLHIHAIILIGLQKDLGKKRGGASECMDIFAIVAFYIHWQALFFKWVAAHNCIIYMYKLTVIIYMLTYSLVLLPADFEFLIINRL